MENQEKYTVVEVLEMTANQLGQIAVPRSMNDQIGIPIDMAIRNLHACLEALTRKQEEPEEENADAE